MKLKEKLCEDSKQVCSRHQDPCDSFEEGFLAGFEKAMELERNYIIDNQIEGTGQLGHLGEEEVKELRYMLFQGLKLV